MNSIEGSIQKDCALIMEALRRMIEGTCCLQDEEKICTWDLFHKTRAALLEHIRFEEKSVLPQLEDSAQDEHRQEHATLLILLEKARWEFESSSGEKFRSLLIEFTDLLRKHHAHDPGGDYWNVRAGLREDGTKPELERIIARSEEGCLG